MQPPRAQASETLIPNGMQSGLSRRSKVTLPAPGSTSTVTVTGDALGQARDRVVLGVALELAAGSLRIAWSITRSE